MKLRKCKVPGRALASYLRRHADDLPRSAIQKATSKTAMPTWTTYCDKRGIAAAMRYEQNDWYLCTLKNAAVRPDLRGRGHGSRLYTATANAAKKHRKCKVLAADVTVTNIPSIKALKRAGFKKLDSFCWKRGQKPADIMNFVKLPPRGGKCR